MNRNAFVFGLMLVISTTQANDAVEQRDILAQRGKGVVTQSDFAARADKIPADAKLETLRSGNRVRDLINTLLLRSQLASDAREAGFDQEPIVKDRMRLAAEAELAEAWAQHYVAMQPAGDYEALAKEYYLLHEDEIMSSPKIDVSHILISTESRSDEEALALAESVSQQVAADPAKFDELVATYSEDPSAKSNNGKFTNVRKGDMVKPFEDVAFALEEGKISGPVKTQYGYHVIRLDAKIAPEKLSFDAVKSRLVEMERKKHDDRIMKTYLGNLSALNVEMTEDALRKMVEDQFGEDFAEPQVDTQKQE